MTYYEFAMYIALFEHRCTLDKANLNQDDDV